ncbi:MAG: hypothetical protein OXN97_07400 [Bryobacterales bacterium]|nr:hypothetical protein [Bryobacterales bacterium]
MKVTRALTSLGSDESDSEQLAALNRNHWHIEHPLRHLRNATHNEDHGSVCLRDLAWLTNTAISIIRC